MKLNFSSEMLEALANVYDVSNAGNRWIEGDISIIITMVRSLR